MTAEEPIAADTLARAWRSLMDGEKPASIARDLGISEERLKRAFLRADLRIDRAAWLEEWLERGEPAADWSAVFLPDCSESERARALARIMARMSGAPIHPRRWQTLEALAHDAGIDPRETIDHLSWAAVARAIGPMTLDETMDERRAMKAFRSALQALVCAEIAPGWDWKKGAARETTLLDEVPAESDALGRIEARADLLSMIERAALSDGERDAVLLTLEELKPAEVAERLGTTRGAIDARFSRALEKIRKTL